MNIISEIDRVFRNEIETLVQVQGRVDGSYREATELLLHCQGKTVVTGTGKSGHIAQKIAATMVSTGTPAMFLHPADALHGDVGIIREGDVILAISKSGETEELLNVLLYAKKMGAPVISITANLESTLAKASQVVLYTPVTKEACPLNLAPTSSTTAALVVGDALAMALMSMRDFRPDQFALLHPGGQLGKRLLLTVADIMRSGDDNSVLNIDASVKEMLFEITSKRTGAVSIVNDEWRLEGLVTDYDIRRVLEREEPLFSQAIRDIMNTNPSYTYSDELAADALDLMQNREKPFIVLPVLDRETNRVVGMVHIHDIIANGL